MRGILLLLCLFVAHSVYAVPLSRSDSSESDDVEQQLIRHHHATDDDDDSASDSADPADSADTSSRAASLLDDESLYDFTVADVLADIIYELKKNPVLLEQLIESERRKVEQRIEEMNLGRQDSYGDDLASYQKTAEQLQNEPKRVEKKAGRSGMPVLAGGQMAAEKRADEVIDNNYAHSDVSQEDADFRDFLSMPLEGGNAGNLYNDVSAFDDVSDDDDATQEDTNGADDVSQSEEDSQQGGTQNTQGNGMTGYEIYQWMSHLPGFQPVRNFPQGGNFPGYQDPRNRLMQQANNIAQTAAANSRSDEDSLSLLHKTLDGKQTSGTDQ